MDAEDRASWDRRPWDTVRSVAQDDDRVDPLVRCTVCRTSLLVDARDMGARLHHYGDGSHRLIPVPNPPGAVLLLAHDDARLAVLAVAIRLQTLADDLDRALADMGIG